MIVGIFCAVASGQGYGATHMAIPGTDSTYAPVDSSKTTTQDSLRLKSARKLTVVKREFSYAQQIGIALGFMAFIAFMMTTAQSWNPQ